MNSQFEKEYFTKRNYADYWQREQRYARMADELLAFLRTLGYQDDELILDYGCAFGFLVAGFRARHANAVGYDISVYAMQQAKLRNVPVVAKPGECSVMVALDVFEHMADADVRTAICACHPRTLVVRTPVSIDGKKFVLQVSRSDKTHVNCKKTAEWHALFQSLGFVTRPINLISVYDSVGVACILGIR